MRGRHERDRRPSARARRALSNAVAAVATAALVISGSFPGGLAPLVALAAQPQLQVEEAVEIIEDQAPAIHVVEVDESGNDLPASSTLEVQEPLEEGSDDAAVSAGVEDLSQAANAPNEESVETVDDPAGALEEDGVTSGCSAADDAAATSENDINIQVNLENETGLVQLTFHEPVSLNIEELEASIAGSYLYADWDDASACSWLAIAVGSSCTLSPRGFDTSKVASVEIVQSEAVYGGDASGVMEASLETSGTADASLMADGYAYTYEGSSSSFPTVDVKADGTITGVCYRGHHYVGSASAFPILMPDGQTVTMYCQDESRGVATMGWYSFTAYPQGDGSYWVNIHCEYSLWDGSPTWTGRDEYGSWGDVSTTAPFQAIGGYWYTVTAPPVERIITNLVLQKELSDQSLAGNSSFSVQGAVYQLDGPYGTVNDNLATDAEGKLHIAIFTGYEYTLHETKASKGCGLDPNVYHITAADDGSVTVTAQGDNPYRVVNNGKNPVTDASVTVMVTSVEPTQTTSLSIEKRSANPGITDGNSCYDLSGAIYGVYASADDAKGNVHALASITTDQAGRGTAENLPALGTYYVKEISAPKGYALDEATHEVAGSGTQPVTLSLDESPITDPVPVGVQKVDALTGLSGPQGGSSLAGAQFTLRYYDGSYELADLPETPTRTWVIETDSDGFANLSSAYLVSGDELYTYENMVVVPLGTLAIAETAAPEGYACSSEVIVRHIDGSQQARIEQDLSATFSEQGVRGDLSFVKVASRSMKRLAGVPFLVESLSTGEAHVVVTDANGQVNTSSDWVAHASRTNANDAAFADDGSVDEALLDAQAGIWFYGGSDEAVLQSGVDERFGALPYDTYRVTELPCTANAGFKLVSFEVQVVRDGVNVDMGTVVDEPAPVIGTTLTGENGSHSAYATTVVTLTDTVEYDNLEPGDYRCDLRLMFADDGSPVTDAAGEAVTGTAAFHAAGASGTVDVPVTFDASGLSGRDVVAFETLYRGDEVVAVHADLSDKGQTVSIVGLPAIGTTLADASTGLDEVAASQATLIDTVSYEGVIPGMAYVLSGTLMDKATGAPATDSEGNALSAQASFVPDESSGVALMAFDVDLSGLAGHTLVAFETLVCDDIVIATHEDLEDEGQTVRIPTLATTLIDPVTASHGAQASQSVTLVDTVSYAGLTPGRNYTLTGYLMDKSSGARILDENGDYVSAVKDFTAESSEGQVDVTFIFDASGLAGSVVVAEEHLSREGVELAAHADIDDASQSVSFAAIGTTLAAPDGTHTVVSDEPVDLVDHVAYEGLIPGRSYVLNGQLMMRGTGLAAVDVPTASCSFVPDEPQGVIDVTFFGVDPKALDGLEVVAFETLLTSGADGIEHEVAAHHDLSDSGQTVAFGIPSIRTELTDAASGLHESLAEGEATLVDTVEYSGLRPGQEYRLDGQLVYRESGERVLDAQGKPVTASTTFTAEKSSGTQCVTFAFDAQHAAGHAIVCFESLLLEGVEVAAHADLEDDAQSVAFIAIQTTASDAADGDQRIKPSASQSLADLVAVRGVTPGVTYLIHTELADAQSHEVVGVSDVAVVPSRTQTAFKVRVTLDATPYAGRNLVFLETLLHDGTVVARHCDYEDKGQTLTVDMPENPAAPSAPSRPSSLKALPKTGDESDLGTPLGLALTGLGIMGTAGVYLALSNRRRSRKS